ncbi:MAG TPA: cache domain-containing protein [Candidatus Cloacimonadota bacterium]|nr:cache domain-containing protein [Candidatus Cloacimonadota bacterium]
MNKITKKLIVVVLLVFAVFQLSGEDNTSNYEEIAQYVIHTTAVGLGAALSRIEGETEQIDFLRNYITPIRFYPDNTGYFYIYDFDCLNLAHATQKDLEGKDLYNYQDCQGKYVIRELSAAAQNGGGFVEFYWQKPQDKTEYQKMGYVEPIPGTKYFIGTGVYLQ